MRALLVGVVLVAAAGPATAADPKAVIEAAIKAHGGKDKLAKYTASSMEFKGEMSVMGLDLTLKGTALTAEGGKTRLDMTSEVAGQQLKVLQVTNGKKAAVKTSLGGMELPAPESALDELKVAGQLAEATKIYPLLDDKKFMLKAGEDADIDGKKASVVVVTLKELSKDVTLYFDKESGLMVKSSRKATGPDGKESDRETVFADFKEVDGLKVPMKHTVYQDGAKFMTMTVTEYKHLEKIDDAKFNLDD